MTLDFSLTHERRIADATLNVSNRIAVNKDALFMVDPVQPSLTIAPAICDSKFVAIKHGDGPASCMVIAAMSQ